ncbi:YiiX/YebB-like N1pC/P60 family cysteine hydrolase [Aliarcobacter skirrowii]|uniref:YiiX/YebB-like N1pC/P60 family cysteine hydrolase n=1 Tax=Aliarcobacter skirrowii TaxID=28200 RepID=UPI00082FAB99|nr:YiiX/YebB-like N1pC/P60 family cysteine hydrolase [Aliarcobacter skirrowii]
MIVSTIGKKYIINYEYLLRGDIILQSGKKIHSKVIQKHTKSHYSHAMICLTKTSLFHAQTEGIFTVNPQRVLVEEKNDLKILRPKKRLTDMESKKIDVFLRSKVGTLYSIKEAIISGKEKRPENSQSQMQFCSRLVAQAYSHVGYMIVENPDFCQPAEIENSDFFEEVNNIIKEATKEEIEFTSTRDIVLENQISTYKWLNKTRNYAKSEFEYKEIHSQNDVMHFLKKHPKADNTVSEYIQKSGYLENYKGEKDNNPWLFDFDLFIKKYNYDTSHIFSTINEECELIKSYDDRLINNYKASANNFKIFGFNYFKLEKNIHKNRLYFLISKYNTFIKASEYILETLDDKNLNLSYNVLNQIEIINKERKKLENYLYLI